MTFSNFTAAVYRHLGSDSPVLPLVDRWQSLVGSRSVRLQLA
uniref:Uncharacterized protein n=1 Tax=Romanomermis culicivorax TaxID=13658 RepID=A0A915IEH6_ROMCU